VARIDDAPVHRVQHLEGRHDGARGLQVDLEAPARHLGDLFREALGIDLVKVRRGPAALHLPLRLGRRRLRGRRHRERGDEQE